MSVVIRGARVLTMGGGERPGRGHALSDVGVVPDADVVVESGTVRAVGAGLEVPAGARTIEGDGRVLMPAFVDCHTHACFAGDRLDEWERKRAGATYLELLEAGGGIMSTVRAVRAASEAELADGLGRRLGWMLREGTTTVEVKSGYGLSTEHELKMLRAIAAAGERWTGTVVPTACVGHAIDGDGSAFVARTIEETLPAVHAEFPGVAIDAYCEKGAWSLADCLKLFDRALELGHPVRVHADQFNDLGMIPEAVRRGFRSVDHLEASTPEHLAELAGSGVFGVMLPCAGFHVDGRYADGRAFVDAGGTLALASNLNPGSAPCASIPMAIALGVRSLGITAHEAIAACTVNAARVLGFEDRGSIAPGMRADLVLLRHTDERQLGYEFGGNPVDLVICRGEVVSPA